MKKLWIIFAAMTLLGITLSVLRQPIVGAENTIPCQPGLKDTNCVHYAILHLSTNVTMDPATPPGAPYHSIVCIGQTVTATSGGYSVISNAVQKVVQHYTGTGPCPPDIETQTLTPTATLGWTILYDNEDFDFGTGPSTGAFSYDIATAGTVTFNFHQIVMPTNSVCGAHVPEEYEAASKSFAFVEAEIEKPNGRFIDGVDEAPTYRYDYQGVCLNSGHPQGVEIFGSIQPDGMIFNWTLDSSVGTLLGASLEDPLHIPSSAAGAGTLTLKAAYAYTGGTNVLACSAKTAGILIYDDHLARDMANFQAGMNCTNFVMPNGANPITFVCHDSTHHANYGGTGSDPFWEVNSPKTTVVVTHSADGNGTHPSLGDLQRGDIVAYYTASGDLMHSQTCLGDGSTTFGANNLPLAHPGRPFLDESWKWGYSPAGDWANALWLPGTGIMPVQIKVYPKP